MRSRHPSRHTEVTINCATSSARDAFREAAEMADQLTTPATTIDLTPCCGAFSTYDEGGTLYCKACYDEVPEDDMITFTRPVQVDDSQTDYPSGTWITESTEHGETIVTVAPDFVVQAFRGLP